MERKVGLGDFPVEVHKWVEGWDDWHPSFDDAYRDAVDSYGSENVALGALHFSVQFGDYHCFAQKGAGIPFNQGRYQCLLCHKKKDWTIRVWRKCDDVEASRKCACVWAEAQDTALRAERERLRLEQSAGS